MKKVKFLLVAIFSISLMMFAMNASATILLNEDFESGESYTVGSTVFPNFVSKNVDISTSETAYGTSDMTMGINLFSGATTMGLTKNQMSRTNETYFSGAYCAKLIGDDAGANTSNTLSMLANPLNPIGNGENYRTQGFRIWQFAVRTDSATVNNIPAGTKIGHFRLAFSTDGTTAVAPGGSVAINFLVNGRKNVDMVCTTTLNRNTSVKIGEFGGNNGQRSWALVTIVQQANPDSVRWICIDKDHKFRGPQPNVANPSTSTIVDSDWYFMPQGINFFVNRNQQSALLSPTDGLSARWGDQQPQASPVDFGWEFKAVNNGVIYMDRMLWGTMSFSDDKNEGVKLANRLAPFDQLPAVSLDSAAGPSWMLYSVQETQVWYVAC